jgi:hypothetical protein
MASNRNVGDERPSAQPVKPACDSGRLAGCLERPLRRLTGRVTRGVPEVCRKEERHDEGQRIVGSPECRPPASPPACLLRRGLVPKNVERQGGGYALSWRALCGGRIRTPAPNEAASVNAAASMRSTTRARRPRRDLPYLKGSIAVAPLGELKMLDAGLHDVPQKPLAFPELYVCFLPLVQSAMQFPALPGETGLACLRSLQRCCGAVWRASVAAGPVLPGGVRPCRRSGCQGYLILSGRHVIATAASGLSGGGAGPPRPAPGHGGGRPCPQAVAARQVAAIQRLRTVGAF